MINLFKMSLQIHNIKFPQVYLWTFWCANKRSPFLQKRIFVFFFSKSCLKVGGAAYTRVFTVFKLSSVCYSRTEQTRTILLNEHSCLKRCTPTLLAINNSMCPLLRQDGHKPSYPACFIANAKRISLLIKRETSNYHLQISTLLAICYS